MAHGREVAEARRRWETRRQLERLIPYARLTFPLPLSRQAGAATAIPAAGRVTAGKHYPLSARLMTMHPELLERITARADVFGGKPTIRDLQIAVEHVLGMLAAGETSETLLRNYPVLEPEDIQAYLVFAHRSIAGERVHEHVPIHGT